MSHPSLFNHLPLHLTNTHILPKLDLYSLLKLNFILKSTRNDASKFENVHGLSNKKYLSIVENIEKSLVKLKICEISFCEVVKSLSFILKEVGDGVGDLEVTRNRNEMVSLVVGSIFEVLNLKISNFPIFTKIFKQFIQLVPEKISMIYLPQSKVLLPDDYFSPVINAKTKDSIKPETIEKVFSQHSQFSQQVSQQPSNTNSIIFQNYLKEVAQNPKIFFIISCLMKVILSEQKTSNVRIRFIKSVEIEKFIDIHEDGYGFSIYPIPTIDRSPQRLNSMAESWQGDRLIHRSVGRSNLLENVPDDSGFLETEGEIMQEIETEPEPRPVSPGPQEIERISQVLSYTPIDDHKYFEDDINYTSKNIWKKLDHQNKNLNPKIFITNGAMGVMDVAVALYHIRNRNHVLVGQANGFGHEKSMNPEREPAREDLTLELYGLSDFTRFEHWANEYEIDWRAVGYAIMSDDVSGLSRFDVVFAGQDIAESETFTQKTQIKYTRLLDEFHYSTSCTSIKLLDFTVSESKLLDIFTHARNCETITTLDGVFERKDILNRKDEIFRNQEIEDSRRFAGSSDEEVFE